MNEELQTLLEIKQAIENIQASLYVIVGMIGVILGLLAAIATWGCEK